MNWLVTECCTNAFSPPCLPPQWSSRRYFVRVLSQKGITRRVRAEICVLVRSLGFLTMCETSIFHSRCFLAYVLNIETLQNCVAKLYFSFSYAKKKKNTKPPTNPYFSSVYGLAISVLLFMPAADHKGYGGFCWRTDTEVQVCALPEHQNCAGQTHRPVL